MGWIAWTLLGLMAAFGLVILCTIVGGARKSPRLNEVEIDYACEEALNRDLSDISFARSGE